MFLLAVYETNIYKETIFRMMANQLYAQLY